MDWRVLALCLLGTFLASFLTSTLTVQAVSSYFGYFYSTYFDPLSNQTESIKTIMSNLADVSTPTKHTDGFLCVAYFGDLGIPDSAPTCPKGTDEMFYAVHKPPSLIFRLCCSLEHKKDRRQCGGLVSCGPSTTQRQSVAGNVLFLNNGSMKLEYEGIVGSGGWCSLEDEATCCIFGVVQKQAGSTLAIVAYELRNRGREFLFVANWTALMVIFLPPFYILAVYLYDFAQSDFFV